MHCYSFYFSCSQTLFHSPHSFFFFFNDTATTEIYTLSLHDALPILTEIEARRSSTEVEPEMTQRAAVPRSAKPGVDRKSTRLNSSHQIISYAVFCLKKKQR